MQKLLYLFVIPTSLTLVTLPVQSQQYPNKPVRMVTAEAGGGADLIARLVAQGISGGLGQNVIVENRPSNLLGEYVAKAAPDGYTLLVGGSTFAIGTLLQKTTYDLVKDFSPIAMLARSPNILVVHPSLPVKSVKELIGLAKTRPGELNYASSGSGGSIHLAAELFKAMAAIDIVRINYKGTAQAVNALLGGQVQLSFPSAAAVTSHIKSGRLRALAVTSAGPSALVPGLPTVAASGLPGYESSAAQGAFAPTGTPRPIINRLNEEMIRLLGRAETKEQLLNAGADAVGSTPEEFAANIKSELTKWGKVLKDAGIRAD